MDEINLPVHSPSRSSKPSAHFSQRSGPSPVHPSHDRSHSEEPKENIYFITRKNR